MQVLPRDNDGQLSAYAWPGGYDIGYLTDDDDILCAECANADGHEGGHADGWRIDGYSISDTWETSDHCAHCAKELGPID